MVAAEIYCNDRGIVIVPGQFPITCPFTLPHTSDMRSPTKLSTIFLRLVPPHPPRRRGVSGVTCGAALGAPPASPLSKLRATRCAYGPRAPTPPAAAAARGSRGPGAELCPSRGCARRAVLALLAAVAGRPAPLRPARAPGSLPAARPFHRSSSAAPDALFMRRS